MSEPVEKHCPGCGKTKPAAEFNRGRTRPDGLQGKCRECERAARPPAGTARRSRTPGEFGWVIAWGCPRTDRLHRLKVREKPGKSPAPIRLRVAPCCGSEHRVAVSPYRQRRSADEPFDAEVDSLDGLR